MNKNKKLTSIWLENNSIKIIDQRKLPHRLVIETLQSIGEAAAAIREMHVRGAPLIGVTAAFGMYLAVLEGLDIKTAEKKLISTRPTAIDLKWAVERMKKALKNDPNNKERALEEALKIRQETIEKCRLIGLHGLKLIESMYNKKKRPINILTHCNAGWLATVDYGTATAPIYAAFEKGIKIHVWVDETRPRNQGARLTAWELGQRGIPYTIIADNTGGHLMQRGLVDLVIVGSDRTTYTGDVCNKIGTYLKALAAKDNKIPFYAALPSSTIDWEIENGFDIPIEERGSEEIKYIQGMNKKGNIEKVLLTPKESNACNYAFDITPRNLVTGLITEKGICSPDNLKKMFEKLD